MRVTYTTTDIDLEAFHATFDGALDTLRSELGREYPLLIDGRAVEGSAPPLEDRMPADMTVLLGRFAAAGTTEVDRAVQGARVAWRDWDRRGWPARIAVLRRAAELLRERKFRLGALMSLEVGKNRFEAMGDAEESADLIDYYCRQLEDANGFEREMARMTPTERNRSVLRPYGVFACIAPFNFPLALSAGMSSAALAAGNAVVYKPAEDAPWTGLELARLYEEAGVPPGVFQHLPGRGGEMGDALWQHPGIDGVVFTGSREVGLRIHHGLSRRYVKPCLLELGGKNAALILPSADLDGAAEGVMKSAFGLQNQKCSATSRVYVHEEVLEPFLERLLARTAGITIGDPARRDVWFGPVINERAVVRYERAVALASREGTVLTGGARLTDGDLARGWFLAPTIATLPLTSSLYRDELFVPFLAVGAVESLDQALSETNAVEYGLTAGVFSRRQDEIERFFTEVEAGVCYANKRSGATTGAWPGAQSFCGWKGSGSTGKGGCGPYYVAQFLREQNRTTIEEEPGAEDSGTRH